MARDRQASEAGFGGDEPLIASTATPVAAAG
jgi:hypothetical protein